MFNNPPSWDFTSDSSMGQNEMPNGTLSEEIHREYEFTFHQIGLFPNLEPNAFREYLKRVKNWGLVVFRPSY